MDPRSRGRRVALAAVAGRTTAALAEQKSETSMADAGRMGTREAAAEAGGSNDSFRHAIQQPIAAAPLLLYRPPLQKATGWLHATCAGFQIPGSTRRGRGDGIVQPPLATAAAAPDSLLSIASVADSDATPT